jgi:hypothetical protein
MVVFNLNNTCQQGRPNVLVVSNLISEVASCKQLHFFFCVALLLPYSSAMKSSSAYPVVLLPSATFDKWIVRLPQAFLA